MECGGRFYFIDAAGSETVFVPAEASLRINATARHLSAIVAPGTCVGLLYKTSPDLISAWIAALLAGLKPLILQYPTRKQARSYWMESVLHTVAEVRLGALIADQDCACLFTAGLSVPCVSQADLDLLPDQSLPPDRFAARERQPAPPPPPKAKLPSILRRAWARWGQRPAANPSDRAPALQLPADFEIIQLSSGTTGFRKAMAFSRAQLESHIADFNATLCLTSSDTIVSWLPLYHDMGYIACFVMPLLLGVDVVMMDAMTWVSEPNLLFDAIDRHAGTVCYMPNFGFEVMARAQPRNLPAMRRWISCSEPVSAVTAARFLSKIAADPATFSACYAMAENVFAVSMGSGISIRQIDGVDVVSCGPPIPGVRLKVVDGELWVRSPSSLARYIGGDDICDDAGYYPTGDLGVLLDGEVYISGRKQDLLVQGGRKFILSDFDLQLNQLFPDIRGRAAALAVRDDRVGTETPLILIESIDFYDRQDGPAIAEAMKNATGVDQIECAFVPPRFLTKTSSGKINRKRSLADWQAVCAARDGATHGNRDPVQELRATFANANWDAPVGEALDSLSRTILTIILDAHGIAAGANRTLREIELDATAAQTAIAVPAPDAEVIRIVSLADRQSIQHLNEAALDRLAAAFGREVTLEHVCLPPSPMILSDLIFHDYFEPRLPPDGFAAVDHVLESIKGASLLITDDLAELMFLYESTYPVLSHNLERSPSADLISFRWQQYTQHHDKLPITVVGGRDIPLSAASRTLAQLERYLGTPIFKMALAPGFGEFTEGWERFSTEGQWSAIAAEELTSRLVSWTQTLATKLKPMPRSGKRLAMSDLPHFCSHSINPDAINLILDRYERFCISGPAASLPHLEKEIVRRGKAAVRVPSHAPATLAALNEPFDCLLICGAWGDVAADIPTIALQHASPAWKTRNLGAFAEELPWFTSVAASLDDWFHDFEFRDCLKYYPIWSRTRTASHEKWN